MTWRKIGVSGVLAAMLFAGCSRKSAPVPKNTAQNSPQSLSKDDLGREIKLPAAPRRIISLAPGVTETIFALGEGERLVGRDQSSDFPAGASRVPPVADFNGPFFEKAVALRPDFIIAQGETYDRARVELWQRKCSAPVALLNANTVEGVLQGMNKIATWLDVPQKAEGITQTFPPAAKASGVRVFFEIGRVPLWSAGRDTLIGDMLARLGYENVARISGYKPFSAESLAKADPDVYIVTSASSDLTATLRELRLVPTLRNLRCIKQGNVVVVPADWLLRPGPRLAQGMRELNKQITMLSKN